MLSKNIVVVTWYKGKRHQVICIIQNESEWYKQEEEMYESKEGEKDVVHCFHGRENNNERYEIYINIRWWTKRCCSTTSKYHVMSSATDREYNVVFFFAFFSLSLTITKERKRESKKLLQTTFSQQFCSSDYLIFVLFVTHKMNKP